jgi:hypothetical protein
MTEEVTKILDLASMSHDRGYSRGSEDTRASWLIAFEIPSYCNMNAKDVASQFANKQHLQRVNSFNEGLALGVKKERSRILSILKKRLPKPKLVKLIRKGDSQRGRK